MGTNAKMKHLIIFGANGLVGQNIISLLPKNIKITKIKFNEIPVDCEMADYVIFGSGYGQPQMFSKQKIETIAVNTTTLIESFKYLKPKGKFLYISTSEVYSGSPPPYRETDIGTTTPQHPRACYIESKRCGEAICMAMREKFDVKIARLALAYGEGTKKGDTRVLNQLIEKALTKGEIKLMDKGEAKRTYCYIKDACELMLKILFEGTQSVYNVGGESIVTIRQLAEMIGEITGAKVILGNEGLKDSPTNVRLDMVRTLWEFPHEFVGLKEGLIRTINYQRTLYE